MKAIIMAGGEGTRLRPLSQNVPKPMVRLFDRPVLAHTLHLLKQSNITDACLTLRFLPQTIMDHFGDGSAYGMRLTHQIEEVPLGTAGGVAACREFIGDEPVLILSGDAVCDFDLTDCIAFHNQRQADATIVLYAHPEPLEYGLVMTAENGRIQRFMEKPPWNQVFTNRINTGIYILSPQVLAEIPAEGSYDFGRDLFPKLLTQGAKLCGVEAKGYWCDIGSPEAYLRCGMDALDGLLGLDFGAERRGQSIWSHAPISSGVRIVEPCYIGKHAVIEPGATIGPYAIIGENSRIGTGATVTRSVVDGANVGQDARLTGSIVGQGASIRRGCVLQEGSVIGDSTVLGEGSVVEANIRIWPGKEIAAGSRVSENLVTGNPRRGLRFSGNNTLWGEAGVVLTPEACFAIGSALGVEGRVGISSAGAAACHLSARALACGVSAVGGLALELDVPFEAAASYAADLYGLQRTVFVREQGDQLVLRFYGPRGMSMTRPEERKIEAALASGELRRAVMGQMGDMVAAAGTLEAYVSAAACWGDLGEVPSFAAEVQGSGSANRALRQAISRMGVRLATHGWGVPVFETTHGGMSLRAEDEEGNTLEPEQLLTILVLLELEAGAKSVAVPYNAPVVLDHIAERFEASILRLGRDPGADRLYYQLPYFRDAVFAACRLVGAMALRGESLYTLAKRAPVFRTARQEVSVTGDRAAVMQALAGTMEAEGLRPELIAGLRVPVTGGWVHVSPSAGRSVLKIHSEATSVEAAEEICVDIARQVEALAQEKAGE
ncbi:MAG: sugar phosphate nucleotidyltransferase [Oscillospiraceae bacterium]|nr:sugar phosphate nucleotidyltransferase [Oscillospiraceae bacterium]